MAPVSRWVDGSRVVARIVAVCQAIKDDLVRQGLPADQDRGRLLRNGHGTLRPRARRRRPEFGGSSASPPTLPSSPRSASGSPRGTTTSSGRSRGSAPRARTRGCSWSGRAPRSGRPLETLARASGLGDAVTIWGYRDDVPEVLAASQVSVDASHEGLGITGTLRESLAMETPVVATRAMGNPELVGHEEHGLLVPPRDPEAMAAAVLRLLARSALGAEPRTGGPRARRRGLLDAGKGRAARAPVRSPGPGERGRG